MPTSRKREESERPVSTWDVVCPDELAKVWMMQHDPTVDFTLRKHYLEVKFKHLHAIFYFHSLSEDKNRRTC